MKKSDLKPLQAGDEEIGREREKEERRKKKSKETKKRKEKEKEDVKTLAKEVREEKQENKRLKRLLNEEREKWKTKVSDLSKEVEEERKRKDIISKHKYRLIKDKKELIRDKEKLETTVRNLASQQQYANKTYEREERKLKSENKRKDEQINEIINRLSKQEQTIKQFKQQEEERKKQQEELVKQFVKEQEEEKLKEQKLIEREEELIREEEEKKEKERKKEEKERKKEEKRYKGSEKYSEDKKKEYEEFIKKLENYQKTLDDLSSESLKYYEKNKDKIYEKLGNITSKLEKDKDEFLLDKLNKFDKVDKIYDDLKNNLKSDNKIINKTSKSLLENYINRFLDRYESKLNKDERKQLDYAEFDIDQKLFDKIYNYIHDKFKEDDKKISNKIDKFKDQIKEVFDEKDKDEILKLAKKWDISNPTNKSYSNLEDMILDKFDNIVTNPNMREYILKEETSIDSNNLIFESKKSEIMEKKETSKKEFDKTGQIVISKFEKEFKQAHIYINKTIEKLGGKDKLAYSVTYYINKLMNKLNESYREDGVNEKINYNFMVKFGYKADSSNIIRYKYYFLTNDGIMSSFQDNELSIDFIKRNLKFSDEKKIRSETKNVEIDESTNNMDKKIPVEERFFTIGFEDSDVRLEEKFNVDIETLAETIRSSNRKIMNLKEGKEPIVDNWFFSDSIIDNNKKIGILVPANLIGLSEILVKSNTIQKGGSGTKLSFSEKDKEIENQIFNPSGGECLIKCIKKYEEIILDNKYYDKKFNPISKIELSENHRNEKFYYFDFDFFDFILKDNYYNIREKISRITIDNLREEINNDSGVITLKIYRGFINRNGKFYTDKCIREFIPNINFYTLDESNKLIKFDNIDQDSVYNIDLFLFLDHYCLFLPDIINLKNIKYSNIDNIKFNIKPSRYKNFDEIDIPDIKPSFVNDYKRVENLYFPINGIYNDSMININNNYSRMIELDYYSKKYKKMGAKIPNLGFIPNNRLSEKIDNFKMILQKRFDEIQYQEEEIKDDRNINKLISNFELNDKWSKSPLLNNIFYKVYDIETNLIEIESELETENTLKFESYLLIEMALPDNLNSRKWDDNLNKIENYYRVKYYDSSFYISDNEKGSKGLAAQYFVNDLNKFYFVLDNIFKSFDDFIKNKFNKKFSDKLKQVLQKHLLEYNDNIHFYKREIKNQPNDYTNFINYLNIVNKKRKSEEYRYMINQIYRLIFEGDDIFNFQKEVKNKDNIFLLQTILRKFRKNFKIIYYAHNGAKFDSLFINDTIKHHVDNIIEKDGLLSLKINSFFEFRDFRRFMPQSLDSICKCFKLDNLIYKGKPIFAKSSFDHTIFNRKLIGKKNNLEPSKLNITYGSDFLKICDSLDDLKDESEIFGISYNDENKDIQFPLFHSFEYCLKDCISLGIAITYFNNSLKPIMYKDPISFLTLPSAAWHTFKNAHLKNNDDFIYKFSDNKLINFVRSAIKGGRFIMNKAKYISKQYEYINSLVGKRGTYNQLKYLINNINNCVKELDMTSLYPTVLYNYNFPNSSKWEKIQENEKDKLVEIFNNQEVTPYKYYIMEVEFELTNPNIKTQTLQWKRGGKLITVLGEKVIDYMCDVDLKQSIKYNGCKVHRIIRGIKNNESVYYGDIIRDLFDMRMDAKKEGNNIMADNIKLTLNAIYGKTLQGGMKVLNSIFSENNYKKKKDKTRNKLTKLFTDYDIKNVEVLDNQISQIKVDYEVNVKKDNSPVDIGVYVLAYSKKIMNKVIKKSTGFESSKALLGDTDCIMMEKEEVDKYRENCPNDFGSYMGQLKDDTNDSLTPYIKFTYGNDYSFSDGIYVYGICVARKTYFFEGIGIMKKDDEDEYEIQRSRKVRTKGIPSICLQNKSNDEIKNIFNKCLELKPSNDVNEEHNKKIIEQSGMFNEMNIFKKINNKEIVFQKTKKTLINGTTDTSILSKDGKLEWCLPNKIKNSD